MMAPTHLHYQLEEMRSDLVGNRSTFSGLQTPVEILKSEKEKEEKCTHYSAMTRLNKNDNNGVKIKSTILNSRVQ